MAKSSVKITSAHYKDKDSHLTNRDRVRDKAEVFKTFFASIFNMGDGSSKSHCPELENHD